MRNTIELPNYKSERDGICSDQDSIRLPDINFSNDDLSRVIEHLDPMRNEAYRKTDEITGGRLFADVFKSVLRFNASTKSWCAYNGIVWEQDEGNAIAERLCQRFTRRLEMYVVAHKSAEPTETENNYQRFVQRLGDRQKRVKMLDDAKPWMTVKETDFDSNPDLLNVQNCVIDLRTMSPIPHDSDLLLTKVCNASYEYGVTSNRWTSFISQIMMNDPEKINYLQRVLGYCLLGRNIEEKAFFFYGKQSRNGKSTLCETVAEVLGDYAKSMSPETLAQRQRDSSRPSEDVARLRGVRLAVMSEPPKKMMLDVALFKNLTGNDKQTASFKYGHVFEFRPVFKVITNTNYLPVVTDDTLFASDRVHVLTFNRKFEETEQNKNLKFELTQPDVMTGILNWLLEGLEKYRAKNDRGQMIGVTPPKAVLDATEEYRRDSDKLGLFIDDCLEKKPGHNISGKFLYEVYTQWCTDCGYGIESKKNFFAELKVRNMYANTGTIDGRTMKRVIPGFIYIGDYQ